MLKLMLIIIDVTSRQQYTYKKINTAAANSCLWAKYLKFARII